MAVYKSKGIVLRSIRYGEADRILDLYTTGRWAGLGNREGHQAYEVPLRSAPGTALLRGLRRLPWPDARYRDPGGDAAQLPRYQGGSRPLRDRRGYGRQRARPLRRRRGRPPGLQPALQRPATRWKTSDSGFENDRGCPRHKALCPRRLRAATRRVSGLRNEPRRGVRAAPLRPRSRGRSVRTSAAPRPATRSRSPQAHWRA